MGLKIDHTTVRLTDVPNEFSAMRRNLEKDVRTFLDDDLEPFMVALLQCVREQGLDETIAQKDAEELLKAKEA